MYRVSYERRGIGLAMRGEERYRVSYARRGIGLAMRGEV